ncbi:hypothetical protein BDV18DRAFT_149048 [Aspergillus unguis]
MSRRRLRTDQLWHFFCPALNLNPSNHSISTLSRTRRPRNPSTVPPDTIPKCLRKPNSSLTQRRDDHSQRIERTTSGKIKTSHYSGNSLDQPSHDLRGASSRARQAQTTPDRRTAEALENRLIPIANTSRDPENVMRILRALIQGQKIKPEARHYLALIQCNTSPQHGSPVTMRDLLSEMNEHGIPLNSDILHAALEVLAVHPDYTLRQDVLRILRDQWLPVSPDGWHYVVAGLIREHQFELAFDHLENMERKGIVMKDWLHSLLIYYLCEFQEFDHVSQLIETRLNQGHRITRKLWEHVLEVAADARHDKLMSIIWKRIVRLEVNLPHYQVCIRVLWAAERTQDTELATSITHMLEQDQDKNKGKGLIPYFTTLSKGYLVLGNLYAALEALCHLGVAGYNVREITLQPVHKYCLDKNIHARDVWNTLKELRAAGYAIPHGCIKLVIRLYGDAAREGDPAALDEAISFYKGLHTIFDAKPTVYIVNNLLSICRVRQDIETSDFLVKDMKNLGVEPNWQTLEILIHISLMAKNLEACYRYIEDFHQQGIQVNVDAHYHLRTTLQNDGSFKHDEVAAKILNHPMIEHTTPELAAHYEYVKSQKEGLLERWRDLQEKKRENKIKKEEQKEQEWAHLAEEEKAQRIEQEKQRQAELLEQRKIRNGDKMRARRQKKREMKAKEGAERRQAEEMESNGPNGGLA